MPKQEDIIKALIEYNLVSEETLNAAIKEAKEQNKKVEDILLSGKEVKEEELTKVKAALFGLPYEDLAEKEIGDTILNIISSEVSENYKIICFDEMNGKIKVGIVDPDNFKAIEAVDFLAKGKGLQVEYYFISKTSFYKAFERYKSLAKELSSALETRAKEEEEETVTIKEEEKTSLEEVTKSAPVAKIVSVIIRHAIDGGASDIHIEPLKNESRVRYRIDGILHTSLVLPRSVHSSIVARVKVMANLKLDETRIPQDGRIKLKINEREVDFRVSTLPLVAEEKVVMRILDTSKGAPTLDALGYQGQQLEVIQNNIKRTEGMFLVTGPTGSGKSTTLFSVLDLLNKEGVNISTLEDPVEYQMKGVNQSQVKPSIGYTFASGLRSFLRQDPDVIMVGEIRDEETAELAVHAALTGHFVLSTLHTNSAPATLPRLMDMGVQSFLLGSTIHTIVAQRLARKICQKCKEECEVPKDYMVELKKEIENIGLDYVKKIVKDFDAENIKFSRGKGCAHCGNSGYSGRIAIAEVLDVNKKLKKMIVDGAKNFSNEEIKSTQRFITIKEDGILKVLQGGTTVEEILRIMKD